MKKISIGKGLQKMKNYLMKMNKIIMNLEKINQICNKKFKRSKGKREKDKKNKKTCIYLIYFSDKYLS